MEDISEDLAKKTRAYWILSSVWNNRMGKLISMGAALSSCTSIMNKTNCERPLSRRVWELQGEFIEGAGRTSTGESKVLQLQKREASA